MIVRRDLSVPQVLTPMVTQWWVSCQYIFRSNCARKSDLIGKKAGVSRRIMCTRGRPRCPKGVGKDERGRPKYPTTALAVAHNSCSWFSILRRIVGNCQPPAALLVTLFAKSIFFVYDSPALLPHWYFGHFCDFITFRCETNVFTFYILCYRSLCKMLLGSI